MKHYAFVTTLQPTPTGGYYTEDGLTDADWSMTEKKIGIVAENQEQLSLAVESVISNFDNYDVKYYQELELAHLPTDNHLMVTFAVENDKGVYPTRLAITPDTSIEKVKENYWFIFNESEKLVPIDYFVLDGENDNF